jgi:hypothetical protein
MSINCVIRYYFRILTSLHIADIAQVLPRLGITLNESSIEFSNNEMVSNFKL